MEQCPRHIVRLRPGGRVVGFSDQGMIARWDSALGPRSAAPGRNLVSEDSVLWPGKQVRLLGHLNDCCRFSWFMVKVSVTPPVEQISHPKLNWVR